MTLNLAYRCTIFAPRGIDPTETSVLTPVGGTPINWLLQSQAWNTSPWAKNLLTATNNNAIAPDGTTTATNLVPDNTSSNAHYDWQPVTVTANERLGFSGFFKANSYNGLYLRITDAAGTNNFGIIVDVVSGLYLTQVSGGGVITGTAVVPLANGWYWIAVAGTLGAGVTAANYQALVYDTYARAQAQTVFVGDTVSGILAWGGQLERNGQTSVTPVYNNYVQTAAAAVSAVFKVATSEGVLGFKPYMGMPSGRRGRMDILAKKTDTGEMTFDILDPRIAPGGSNAQRWFTTFIGDLKGLPRMSRLKALVEESLDGGVTWSAFFTGRIKSFGLKSGSRVVMQMVLRDISDDLTFNIFTGRPHGNVYQTTPRLTSGAQTSTTLKDNTQVWTTNQWNGAAVTIVKGLGVGQRRLVTANTVDTLTVASAWFTTPDATSQYSFGYAQLVSVLPVGFVYPYGGADPGGNPLVPPTKKIPAHIGTIDASNGWATVNLDSAGGILENFLNSSLIAGVLPRTVISVGTSSGAVTNTTLPPQFTGIAIARVRRQDTGAEGDFQLGMILHVITGSVVFGQIKFVSQTIQSIVIRPVSYPLGVATGTPQANGALTATPTANTQSITTKGWTISTTNILVGGDIISFAGHAQRYQIVSSVNSDGSGNSTVTIQPGLQSNVANSEAITVQATQGKMALPPTNTAVQLSVTCDMRLQDGGSQDPATGRYLPGNLLLINDVHPAQVLRDAMLGFYGRVYQPAYDLNGIPTVSLPPGKNLGDPWFPVAIKDTDPIGDGRHGFTALLNDNSFPPFRCIIDKQMPIRDFVETYICKPYGIGYYFDPTGAFVPVDMRQPNGSITGITTVADADLIDDTPPTWSYDPTQGLSNGAYTIYAEGVIQPVAFRVQVGDGLPVITSKMFDVASGSIIDLALGNPDLSQKQFQLDGKGYRAMPGENVTSFQFGYASNSPGLIPVSRFEMMGLMIQNLAMRTVSRPYGQGPQIVSVKAQRNANTASIFPGGFFVLSTVSNPDTASNTRGPSRLIMCSERAENGATVQITGVDWGLTGVAGVPVAIGNPTNLAGDTAHSQTCTVTTLNAQNEAAEVWINVTATSVAVRPVDTDPGWMIVGVATASGQVITKRNLPTGNRVWWRARTNPQRPQFQGTDLGISALKLPSGWVNPAVDHADLTTMSAPTALVSSAITANGFTVVWTPADATRQVEIWLATPTTDARQRIATLPPGSTRFVFTGLVASSTYRAAIREIDGVGGFAEATIDVATTSSAPVINPPYNIRILRVLL